MLFQILSFDRVESLISMEEIDSSKTLAHIYKNTWDPLMFFVMTWRFKRFPSTQSFYSFIHPFIYPHMQCNSLMDEVIPTLPINLFHSFAKVSMWIFCSITCLHHMIQVLYQLCLNNQHRIWHMHTLKREIKWTD